MLATLVLYVIIVIPVISKIYTRDKGKFTVIKGLNVLITFLIFEYFIESFRENIFWLLGDFSNNISILYDRIGIIPPIINVFGYFSYIVLSVLTSVMMIAIAMRNEQAYRRFLYIIPFLWVSHVLYLNFKYMENLQVQYETYIEFKFIFFISVILAIIWVVFIRIFYNKSYKRFFSDKPVDVNSRSKVTEGS